MQADRRRRGMGRAVALRLILIFRRDSPDTAERDLGAGRSEGIPMQEEPSQEQSVFGDYWRFSKSYPLSERNPKSPLPR